MNSATALLAIAALAVFAVTARADEPNKIAEGIMNVVLYDKKCEPVTRLHKTQVALAITPIPRSTLYAAADRVWAAYKNAGTARYCSWGKAQLKKADRHLR